KRIHEVIVFHKLSKDEILEIVDLMVDRVRTQVAEHELQLDLSQDAKELLVDKGWDPAMGARPLRRAIQRYIEDPLADEVLKAGQMTPGSTVQVERDQKGDEEDHPLKLTIVKPRKRPAKKKSEPEKVGVGAQSKGDGGDDEESGNGGEPEASGDGEKSRP